MIWPPSKLTLWITFTDREPVPPLTVVALVRERMTRGPDPRSMGGGHVVTVAVVTTAEDRERGVTRFRDLTDLDEGAPRISGRDQAGGRRTGHG